MRPCSSHVSIAPVRGPQLISAGLLEPTNIGYMDDMRLLLYIVFHNCIVHVALYFHLPIIRCITSRECYNSELKVSRLTRMQVMDLRYFVCHLLNMHLRCSTQLLALCLRRHNGITCMRLTVV